MNFTNYLKPQIPQNTQIKKTTDYTDLTDFY